MITMLMYEIYMIMMYELMIPMHMQFALSPSAHYLNQAPELTRAFIRGDISVMQLYNNMPI